MTYTLNNASSGQHYGAGLIFVTLDRAVDYATVLSRSLVHPIVIRQDGGPVIATVVKGARLVEPQLEPEPEPELVLVAEPEPEPELVLVAEPEPEPSHLSPIAPPKVRRGPQGHFARAVK